MRRGATIVLGLMVLGALLVQTTGRAEAVTVRKWNFQPQGAPVPSGWLADSGLAFSATRGYGWTAADGLRRQCGDRNAISDQVRDTFCHAQLRWDQRSDGTWYSTASPASWKASVADGQYDVTVVVGESKVNPSTILHSVQVEGLSFVSGVATSPAKPFVEVTKRVTVAGGLLDVTFTGGQGTKIVALSAASASTSTTTTSTTSATTTTSVAPPPSGGSSLVVFNYRGITDGVTYIRDANYADPVSDFTPWSYKPAKLEVTIHSTKSTLHKEWSMCVWDRGPEGYHGPGSDESCASVVRMDRVGTYVFTLKAPTDWWAREAGTGNFDWNRDLDTVGIMVKDGTYMPKLLMYKTCGAHCHPLGESYVRQHVPIDATVKLTFFK
jgi:hypothetical protein